MATRRSNRRYALVLSVLAHAALVVAMTFSLPLQPPQQPGGTEVVPIETVMINETALEAELDRIDAERVAEEQARIEAEQAEQRRIEEEQAAAERERIAQQEAAAEAERIREQEAAAERLRIQQEAEAAAEAVRQREERERLVQEEAERLAREQEQREAEEAARLERERLAREEAERQQREQERREAEAAARRAAIAADVARAADAEEAARQARESGLQDQWLAQISNRIERFWRRPPTAQAGIVCVLDVDWVRTGDVVGVSVVEAECNGDAATRRSIENAVLEASPLPQPPVPNLFDRNLRIRFAPD